MESGHSFLPNDRDFGSIEKRSKKHSLIYDIDHWIEIIKEARSKKQFEVTKMKGRFFDYKKVMDSRIFSKNFKISTLKWFKVFKNSNLIIYKMEGKGDQLFKYQFDVKFGVGNDLSKCPEPPIKKAKYDDILSLFSLIPQKYHQLYLDLLYDELFISVCVCEIMFIDPFFIKFDSYRLKF